MTRFRCISADPPWLERGGGKSKRGADRHYDLMSKEDIARAMLKATCPTFGTQLWRPETSAHLWLWVTNNFLRDGLWVMERVGFEYKTNWAWVKGVACGTCEGRGHLSKADGWMRDSVCNVCRGIGTTEGSVQIGLGQYQRGSHELLLLGTRGGAMVPEPPNRLSSVIIAPRTKHSAKPQAAYDLIERVTAGPRLEMFAREPRTDWTTWGNEVAA